MSRQGAAQPRANARTRKTTVTTRAPTPKVRRRRISAGPMLHTPGWYRVAWVMVPVCMVRHPASLNGMTTSTDILIDSITRVRETATRAVRGLSQTQLEARVDPQANTIAWLLWHLARGQDIQVSDVAGSEQGWTS